jgi:hypothetical protein
VLSIPEQAITYDNYSEGVWIFDLSDDVLAKNVAEHQNGLFLEGKKLTIVYKKPSPEPEILEKPAEVFEDVKV